jgi:predicted transcriptional regulator of viral defense system
MSISEEVLLETIRVYLKLVRYGKPVTIRGFQRLMNYSSPGKAQRVLQRLERMGLISRTPSNEYVVNRKPSIILTTYIIIRNLVIPRSLIYTLYAVSLVFTYILLANPPMYLILLLVSLTIPYITETVYYYMLLRRIMSAK